MLAQAGRHILDRTLGPLAARMPRVHPNVVTASSLGVAVLGGYALYSSDRHPGCFLVAAALGILYGFLDALDGIIARMHAKTSAWGDFLDHTFDRLSALVALAGLAASGHTNVVLVLVLMLGALWHGYLGTQLEASFGIRVYRGVGIAEAILAAVVFNVAAYWIVAAGLPFTFREPLSGARLSVTDVFVVLTYPLLAMGTIQRFSLGRSLARRHESPGRRRSRVLDRAGPRREHERSDERA